MINQKYRDAYREVLEIFNYLPEKELSRIPKEKIEYFRENQNINHIFYFDSTISLSEQNISRETYAIILNLLNDYFFNEEKKERLKKILEINENNYQRKMRQIYNSDNIFKIKSKNMENKYENEKKEIAIVQKEKWYQKILRKIKNFL